MQTLMILAISFFSSSIGVLVLLYKRNSLTDRTHAVLTGASAGVMMGASFMSLLGPALNLLKENANGMTWLYAAAVFVAGAVAMEIIHSFTPHEHEIRGPAGPGYASQHWRRGILITCAMALHNLPEGLALGIGSLQQDPNLVRGLIYGIAGQNIPEGAMTALAMLAAGASVRAAFIGVLVTAMVEAAGAFCGLMTGSLTQALLPWSLMFCGGAMIYVISQEMIPESHAKGQERIATFSLIAGLIFMGWLNV